MAGEGFLGRWSRLKRDAELESAPAGQAGPDLSPQGQPAQVAAFSPGAPSPAHCAEASAVGNTHAVPGDLQDHERVELPSIDSLGKDSDFSLFMRAEVDPGVRLSALKKLFTDPHFNQMDGLDIYIDDYSKPDPMPLAMLKRLNQSRLLGLMEDDQETKVAQKPDADPIRDERPLEVADAGVGDGSGPGGMAPTADPPAPAGIPGDPGFEAEAASAAGAGAVAEVSTDRQTS